MRKGIIYMATSPSGKSYIGQSMRTLEDRKKGHKNGSGKYNFAFPRAIRKYGINNFEWKILYDNVPEINLNLMEIWAIAKYETGKFSYYRLAKEYDVGRGQIRNVIECKTERSRCSLTQETSK